MERIIYTINRIPLSMNNEIVRRPDEIYRIIDDDMITLNKSNLFIAQYLIDRFDDLTIGDCIEYWIGSKNHAHRELNFSFNITPELFGQLTNKKEIAQKIKEKFHFVDYNNYRRDQTNIVSKTLIEELCKSKNPYDAIVNAEVFRNAESLTNICAIPLQDIKNDIVSYIGNKFLMPPYGQTTGICENDVIVYNIYNQTIDNIYDNDVHILNRCVVTKDHMKKFYNDKENNMDVAYEVVRKNDNEQENVIFKTIDTSMKTLNKDTLTILEFIYNQYNDIHVGDVIKHMPAVTGTNSFAMDWDIIITADLYCQLMDKSIRKMALITKNDKRWDELKRIYHYTDDKYKSGDDKSYVISKELLCKIMQVEDKLNKTKIQIWVKRNNVDYYGESCVNLKDIKNDIVSYVAKEILIPGYSEYTKLEEGDLIQYAIFNINKTPLGIEYNGYMEYDNTTNFNIYDACIVSSDHIKRVYQVTKKNYLIMKRITDANYIITKQKKVVDGEEVVYDEIPYLDKKKESSTEKREDYISWNEYFMGTAILAGHRSKDPGTQVGACIVDSDNKIVSIGYNGFPKNCSDEEFPWARKANDEYDTKYMYVVHAELNAILNAGGRSLKDTTIFVTLFPCNECAKAIIQSGIKKIIYQSDKYADSTSTKASKRMLEAAGVELVHLPVSDKSITIII